MGNPSSMLNPFAKGGLLSDAPASGSPQTTGTDFSQLYNSYLQYLPQIAGANNLQQTPQAQALLQATQATNPGYQTLANQNAQAAAQSNLGLIQGAGGQTAQAGQSLNQLLNPNYYGAQGAATQGAIQGVGAAGNLLGAINLTGLSPGEAAATERANNQNLTGTGNLGLLNNTNAISNALNFGGAFNNKLGILGSAIGANTNAVGGATGAANSAAGNAGFSPTGAALSTGLAVNNPNFGANSFSTNTGNALLGSATGIQQSYINPQATSAYQNSPGGQNTAKISSLCCFIFLEALNGELPWWVRVSRDYYYEKEPSVAEGYKKMAKWLVPLMKKFSIVKYLVNRFMVKPIIEYGGFLWNVKGYEKFKSREKYKKFWFFVWRNL